MLWLLTGCFGCTWSWWLHPQYRPARYDTLSMTSTERVPEPTPHADEPLARVRNDLYASLAFQKNISTIASISEGLLSRIAEMERRTDFHHGLHKLSGAWYTAFTSLAVDERMPLATLTFNSFNGEAVKVLAMMQFISADKGLYDIATVFEIPQVWLSSP